MLGTRRVAEIWRTFCKSIQSFYHDGSLTSALAVVAGKIGRPVSAGAPPEESAFQAQKMEALGRLTGGVAHDFNNLLTVVLGNATALRVSAEAHGDGHAVRRAEMIERAAERGGRLAGQLLAFSRKQMLRPETISVYDVISSMHELLAQAAGETMQVVLHTEQGLWNCYVDPGQLEAAILNLVLNARDAMPVGGNITISCSNARVRSHWTGASARARGHYVRIDVNDTGTGIAPELLEKVFEPFFTTKPVGKGSGLGLAQVHGFAGQSGGWVELDSMVGRGTTVSLFLPRAKGRDSDPPPQAEGAAPGGNNQTVLVVEPDADLRTTTCETLTRSGYRTLAAANASGALAHLVSEERIRVLLTEADLPGGVSGIALARSARQVRPNLRVLVTSGKQNDAPAEARQASLGGDKHFEFLMKPYRVSDLVRVVGAVLTRDAISVETEELLAEARANASLVAPSEAAASGYASSGADLLRPAGVRHNAIRLGVMPFRTIGSTRANAFSLGLAEEITTAFSRFRSITCVATASVAALANEPPGQTERWRQLDLDVLMQGSFRQKGNEIRIVLRLLNMRGSGEITWGRRFDGLMPDLPNLQDRIASETASQVASELLVWEGQQAAARPQVNPTAYDLMLRAIPAIYCLDEATFLEARLLLEQSLALDPSCAACHSWLAHWYLLSIGQWAETDRAQATQRADQLSQRAVILDPGDARGFTVAGHVRGYLRKDAEAAVCLHERAIALNPNLAMAWCYSGLAHSYLGEHAEAIRHIQHAQQLSPHDPHGFFFDMALAIPLVATGQYEAAARMGRRALGLHPGLSSTYRILLSALGHLGASQEAADVRKGLLALEPHFSVRKAVARSALLRPEDLNSYAEGLRLAGVPE